VQHNGLEAHLSYRSVAERTRMQLKGLEALLSYRSLAERTWSTIYRGRQRLCRQAETRPPGAMWLNCPAGVLQQLKVGNLAVEKRR
jgi:hypothetical protein